ncbi:MAG: DUF485 domain-containing protein [Aquabacterium sp.]|uniref:DUF485 domain-containing protein n=1 Tax=Aquabacterium sp. TaxID=1872578 RepID=UPI003BDED0C0
MTTDIYRRVEADPAYQQLTQRRGRFALALSFITLLSYYAFMAVVAFAPKSLHTTMFEGGTLTIGVPMGVTLILGSWLLTGWYVRKANTEFDQLTQSLVERHQ